MNLDCYILIKYLTARHVTSVWDTRLKVKGIFRWHKKLNFYKLAHKHV